MEPVVPILIGDNWTEPEVEAFTPVHNPCKGEVIARTPRCTSLDVDLAVRVAQEAYSGWSTTPAPERARILFSYKALLEAHVDELSRIIAEESGKTLEEAGGDLRRGIEVVEFACGIGHLSKGETLPELASGIDGMTTREPLGVCAGITPFNFPAMVPMWMYPVAIACGNSFILKPSEKVPLTANRLAELFLESGLPAGILNIVHGGKDVVDAICVHTGIAAVSFVGSSAVARHVYELSCQHGKRVQSAGGAKNTLLVMPDVLESGSAAAAVDQDPTVRAIMNSAFGCAGQRCMAGSLLLGVGDSAEALKEQVLEAMDRVVTGDTLDNPAAGMGAVIDSRARDRLFEQIDEAPAQGMQVARDGREGIPERGFFVGPTLLDKVTPHQRLFTEELFGPVLGMMRPRSLDEAIEWTNRIPFGNAATIFTHDGGAARKFAREVECGMVGINLGVPAPMALFSFSGWDQSFYGDLHVQGSEGVMFYTRQKTVLTRWGRVGGTWFGSRT